MRQKPQITDGILNRSISQNRTERGREISESSNELPLLSELLFVDIIDSEKMFECKQSKYD
jgi:hypothetical protein